MGEAIWMYAFGVSLTRQAQCQAVERSSAGLRTATSGVPSNGS